MEATMRRDSQLPPERAAPALSREAAFRELTRCFAPAAAQRTNDNPTALRVV